jgi:hypothetical protein
MSLVLLISLLGFTNNARGEKSFFTDGEIINCYQNVLLHSGNQINLLNIGGLTSFRFNKGTGNLQTTHIRIQISDGNGGYIDLIDAGGGLTLEDDNFQWIGIPQELFQVIPLQVDDGTIINTNSFTFGNVTSAKLTLYSSLDINYLIREIDLNFFNSLDEAFTFEPEDGSCFKYDPFSLRASTLLDGLCGTSDLKLEPVPSNPLLPQLAPSYDLDFPWDFGFFKTIPVSKSFNVGDHCDYCLTIAVPHSSPSPVTCGCTSFNLTFTLQPCNGATSECPPLEMSEEIEVCCSCDIRGTPPAH